MCGTNMDDKPPKREQRGLILLPQGLIEAALIRNSLLIHLVSAPLSVTFEMLNLLPAS